MNYLIALIIPITLCAIEIEIPTEKYTIDHGVIYMEDFGHTPGSSLPVRVFPVITPPTIEIYKIELSGNPVPMEEFRSDLTYYSIQRSPLLPIETIPFQVKDMGLVLEPMRLQDNVIYPLLIYPFYYGEDNMLFHTPSIDIEISLNVEDPTLSHDPYGGHKINKSLCILTTQSVKPILSNFVSIKESQGYACSIIMPPSKDASEIREFIKEMHSEWSFSYLLIIGDYLSIPPFKFRGIYTDYFYGEFSCDSYERIEPFAEVVVGRIPCADIERIEEFLSNSVNFQIRDEEAGILFRMDEDITSPRFIKDTDSLLSPYDIDYEISSDRYSLYINHTLDIGEDVPVEDAIIISTVARSAEPLLKKYKGRVACIVAPINDSYIIAKRPGGTSTYLYNILKNFLSEDKSIGEAKRLASIDYWVHYPDSFTDKNIASFQILGDPTNTFKASHVEDIGIKELLQIPFKAEPGESLSPVVLIENFGDKVSSNGKVGLEISQDGKLLYSNIFNVTDINPQQERRMAFPDFELPEGKLSVSAWTIFPADINAMNDKVEKTIISKFDAPLIISSDTIYAKIFSEYLPEEALFSADTTFRDQLNNVFVLEPLLVYGEKIYIEGFSSDRDYDGSIRGVGRLTGYTFDYKGSLCSSLSEPFTYDSLSVAMVDNEETPVAFCSDSRFIFLGRASCLDQPALFIQIISSHLERAKIPLEDTLLTLFECTPNPTRGETAVLFEVPLDDAYINLSIYDITGHLVRMLVDKRFSRGIYSYIFDGLDEPGRELVTGTYFVSLSINGMTFTRKLIKLR